MAIIKTHTIRRTGTRINPETGKTVKYKYRKTTRTRVPSAPAASTPAPAPAPVAPAPAPATSGQTLYKRVKVIKTKHFTRRGRRVRSEQTVSYKFVPVS